MQNTVTQLVKIPDGFRAKLDKLTINARSAVAEMLVYRDKSSSKYYPDIPCVIAKSLITKYQRNWRCQSVKRITLPICGDKGRQVKLVENGFRIPSVFGKTVIQTSWRHPILGNIRQIELLQRNGDWFATVSYNTIGSELIKATSCIGIDRNSVGNIAVMADPTNGYVEHLGFNPAKTKEVWRNRRSNLQKLGKNRLLSRIRRKQERRTKLENHIVSKHIVDYAVSHCRAIAIESLNSVVSKGSKIKRYQSKEPMEFCTT